MTIDDEAPTNLAERIAAAYVSYLCGHKGVDRTSKVVRGHKLGQFWLTTAEAMLKAFSARRDNVLTFEGKGSTRIQ
jgi:hypothetical protein